MDPSELDSLYAAPLGDFVSLRNDLAKALRRAGRKEEASDVKALAKPSLVAWTINQIARRHHDAVNRLFVALDRVRDAQLGTKDEANRPSLSEAMAAEREALDEIATTAQAVLTEGGHSATKATVDRVARSMRAAAADPAKRTTIVRGQLSEDVEDDGFAGLAAQLAGAAVPKASKPRAKPDAPTRDRAKAPSPTRAKPRAAVAPPTEREPPTAPPIDLAAERERRAELERVAQKKAREEKIAARRREIDAFRLTEQKLAKDVQQAARDLKAAEDRAERAREQLARAEGRLETEKRKRAQAVSELKTLETEDDQAPS